MPSFTSLFSSELPGSTTRDTPMGLPTNKQLEALQKSLHYCLLYFLSEVVHNNKMQMKDGQLHYK